MIDKSGRYLFSIFALAILISILLTGCGQSQNTKPGLELNPAIKSMLQNPSPADLPVHIDPDAISTLIASKAEAKTLNSILVTAWVYDSRMAPGDTGLSIKVKCFDANYNLISYENIPVNTVIGFYSPSLTLRHTIQETLTDITANPNEEITRIRFDEFMGQVASPEDYRAFEGYIKLSITPPDQKTASSWWPLAIYLKGEISISSWEYTSYIKAKQLEAIGNALK